MQMMMPTLAPDMSFYSLLAVTKRLNGIGKAEQISQLLFSSPSAALRHDFPSNLDVFCIKTGNAFGNPVEVATNTSVLPYFLRFRSQNVHYEAWKLMLGPTVEPLKFVLGLPPGPSGSMMPLCYCRECLDEDIRNFGYPYWHRKHQLPSVLVCPTHSTPLNYANIRIDGRGRSGLFLPDDSDIQNYQSSIALGRAQPILERLSSLSSMALENELSTQYSPDSLRAAYLHGLKQQGLLTPSGHIRAREFIGRLTKHYEIITHLSPFDRIIGKDTVEGMLRLVRKPRGNFHTASHLIMIDFLFGDWKLFNSVYLWDQQMDLPLDAQNDFKLTSSNYHNLDSCLEHRLLDLVKRFKNKEGSFSSIAKQLDININTAMRWLGKLGLIEIPRKPKILTSDIKNNVICLLKQGLPLKAIASQSGLSISTIDRVCSEQPNLQQLWRAAKKEWKRNKVREKFSMFLINNPALTQTELRQNSDSGYCWLYRHDLDWLSKNLPQKQPIKRIQIFPTKPRINWGKRDDECLAALKTVNISNLQSWERIKSKAILRRLPKLSFSPRLNKLPKSSAWVTIMLSTLNRLRTDV
ncbi:MAG: TnsD family Tn7-like transposition protein [Methylotenera sp.]|nr:TnsD family Tn7-like transposition protein [Methylotenera sp.]MDP2404287.1 TnsD family Tn7-like transposition protein [Methylotenera sp.]MDP3095950.1 TnsD family Tn7-like transposition protein [Methylotenera sp.]MDZ4223634.1 TnsD family Tn7-like transposition protein [Methylotenera sp.]